MAEPVNPGSELQLVIAQGGSVPAFPYALMTMPAVPGGPGIANRQNMDDFSPSTPAGPTVLSIDVSPDGTKIAVAYSTVTLLFDAITKNRLASTNLGATCDVSVSKHTISWSPDSRYFAVAVTGAGLKIFDTGSRTLVPVNTVSLGETGTCVAWSPDGKEIAVGIYAFPWIRLYNFELGGFYTIPTPNLSQAVTSLSWRPDGLRLAVGCNSGVLANPWLTVYDTSVSPPVKLVFGQANPTNLSAVYTITYAPSGRYLLLGCSDGTRSLVAYTDGYTPTSYSKPILPGSTVVSHIRTYLNRYVLAQAADTKLFYLYDYDSGSESASFNDILGFLPVSPLTNILTHSVSLGRIGTKVSNADTAAVVDSEGNPVAGMEVRLYSRVNGYFLRKTTTDANGRYTLYCESNRDKQVVFVGKETHEGSILVDRITPA